MATAKGIGVEAARVAVGATVALFVATNLVAAWYRWDASLGAPLFTLHHNSFYAPWKLIEWWSLWRHQLIVPTVGMYAVGASLIAMIWLTARNAVAKKPTDFGDIDELFALGLLDNEHGMVLGYTNSGTPIVVSGEGNALIAGPPGTGKTVNIAMPTVLAWRGSVVVFDPKCQIAPATGKFRSTLGEVVVFNPTDPDSCCINPIHVRAHTRDEYSDIMNVINELASSRESATPTSTSSFYKDITPLVFSGIIRHIIHDCGGKGLSGGAILSRLASFEKDTLPGMRNSKQKDVREAASMFDEMSDTVSAGVISSIAALLVTFRDPSIADKTSRSDVNIDDIMAGDKPMTLCIQIPYTDTDRLRPLTRLLITQIINRLMFRTDTVLDGRKKRHEMLLVAEEFPSQGRVDSIFNNLRVMREYGIKAMLLTQSITAIKQLYKMMPDGVHYIVGFRSLEKDDQEFFSDACGVKDEIGIRETRKHGLLFREHETTVSQSTYKTRVLSKQQFRGLPKDRHVLIAAGEEKAFLLKSIPWFKHPRFAQMGTNTKAGEKPYRQSQRILDLNARAATVHATSSDPTTKFDLRALMDAAGWTEEDIAREVFHGTVIGRVRQYVAGTMVIPKKHHGKLSELMEMHRRQAPDSSQNVESQVDMLGIV